jgi:hypothetical protein
MRGRLLQRQNGIALLLILLVLFTGSTAVFLSAVNNTNVDLIAANNSQREMVQAKQTLLAFAMAYAELFPNNPPGRFPCPDTNNDGLPDFPCSGSNVPGRLPQRINTGPDASFKFSDHGMANDQRFWYAVSPDFAQGSSEVLNSSSLGTLSLDSQADIVAVLIAPGNLLSGRSGGNSTRSNYLENANIDGTTFVSNQVADPASFNDRLLPIYRHEVMTLVSARVVQIVRGMLNTYYLANGNQYPEDEPTFLAALEAAPIPAWFVNNQWHTVINYALSSDKSHVSISFDGCAITYTVSSVGQSTIKRSQASCEVHT